MKRTTPSSLLRSALACGLVAPAATFAGGLSLYEIGTPDVGLASAGYSTRAQDASTLYKNPAGMSYLKESQLQVGLQGLYGNVNFSPNANTSLRLGRDDGGNAVGFLPGLSAFYVQELGEKLRVGIGTFSNFGLAQEYDKNWVGRYYVQKSALLGLSLMPSVSYQINEMFSVGAGMNVMYGYLNNEVAINNLAPGYGDGQMKLNDTTFGFGANAGVLFEPKKGTRIGLTYQSPIKLDFEDRPSYSNLGPGFGALLANPAKLNLGMTVPQSVMLGVYQELNEKLALMADVGWQNWSQFGKVDVGVDSANPKTLTANLNYDDTWHAALGAQYKLTEKWQLTGGFAYDSSAVSDKNRSVALPMGQAWRFGVGALWQVSEKINLGAAYEFMWAGDMSVDQGSNTSLRGRVSGAWEDTSFSFLTVNMSWRF
jgi:long-chain fatty acid transport protein